MLFSTHRKSQLASSLRELSSIHNMYRLSHGEVISVLSLEGRYYNCHDLITFKVMIICCFTIPILFQKIQTHLN